MVKRFKEQYKVGYDGYRLNFSKNFSKQFFGIDICQKLNLNQVLKTKIGYFEI